MKIEERATGELFGKLFPAYDDKSFLFSMELFARRFSANNFPLDWFKGKQCLDVGCGGGRYTMAMAGLGADHCVGVDLGEESIRDAKRRAAGLGLTNTEFRVASAAELPFEEDSFDAVLFSGVLQHTAAPIHILGEVSRVIRSGGMLYLLVYATEGVRWPLIQMLRPVAQAVGFERMDLAVTASGLAVHKRRTYLDDLFVPYIDFYSWQCLEGLLLDKGFSRVERWDQGRLDHEESLEEYLRDLEGLLDLMVAADNSCGTLTAAHHAALGQATTLCRSVVEYVRQMFLLQKAGKVTEEEAMRIVIGQGHHRVVAWKD